MSVPIIPCLAILALVLGIVSAYLRLYAIDKDHEKMGRILAAPLYDPSPSPVRDTVSEIDAVTVAPYQASAEEEFAASIHSGR